MVSRSATASLKARRAFSGCSLPSRSSAASLILWQQCLMWSEGAFRKGLVWVVAIIAKLHKGGASICEALLIT